MLIFNAQNFVVPFSRIVIYFFFISGLERSTEGIHPMTDTYCCYVYENQRWNPLSGFTTHGLPTDRPMWSDSTGRKKRTKESIRLLSKHWQWVSLSFSYCFS